MVNMVKDEGSRAMAGSRSLSEVCFKASVFQVLVQTSIGYSAACRDLPAFLLVGLGTWPSGLVFPLHKEENMTQESLCPLSYPWRTHSVLNAFQHLRKKDMVIRSASLTAKKMLDVKQINVVLTKPFQSALLSIRFGEENSRAEIPLCHSNIQTEVFSFNFLSNLFKKISYLCRHRGT